MVKVYIDVGDVEAGWSVIHNMQIGGAPLIAIVAVLGFAVDLNSNPNALADLDAIDASDIDYLLVEDIQNKDEISRHFASHGCLCLLCSRGSEEYALSSEQSKRKVPSHWCVSDMPLCD
jgi:hypothetical protein